MADYDEPASWRLIYQIPVVVVGGVTIAFGYAMLGVAIIALMIQTWVTLCWLLFWAGSMVFGYEIRDLNWFWNVGGNDG